MRKVLPFHRGPISLIPVFLLIDIGEVRYVSAPSIKINMAITKKSFDNANNLLYCIPLTERFRPICALFSPSWQCNDFQFLTVALFCCPKSFSELPGSRKVATCYKMMPVLEENLSYLRIHVGCNRHAHIHQIDV